MKAYKTSELEIQLYQISPNTTLMASDARAVRDSLLEGKQLEEAKESILALESATTLSDVIQALAITQDQNHRARLITSAFNRFLGTTSVGDALSWDKTHRGIRISDEAVLKTGKFRNILTAMIAQLRFDRFDGDKPVFTVVIRNPLYFSQNLNVEDLADFLHDRRKVYLPAYDLRKDFNNILRSVDRKEVYFFEQRSRKNPNPRRIGERFVAAGRMTQEEYNRLDTSKAAFPICYSTPYNDYKKQYCYPARDIEIVASDSLLKLQNDNPLVEFPVELGEAIALYRFAKSNIREHMDARTDLMDQISSALHIHFDLAPALQAECKHLQTPRYKLKGRTKITQAVKSGEAFYTEGVSELGINALCYPSSESTPEREAKFLSFFSPTSKAGDFGFEFELVSYSARVAVSEPVKTAERIIQASGGCDAALIAWPNWPHLPNNKMLEFELMRRGVAVQHVINQNFKQDAPKISSLIKGMAEKFPTTEVLKNEEEGSILPFHYALGLDVSRHGSLDIAAFPIVIDRNGRVSCTLSDTPPLSG
jgi:hypothetical protein